MNNNPYHSKDPNNPNSTNCINLKAEKVGVAVTLIFNT